MMNFEMMILFCFLLNTILLIMMIIIITINNVLAH